MKYKIETKSLEELVQLYDDGNLNLTPPYQRNAVWTKAAQVALVDSIRNNFPLPTFFLMKKQNNNYEMVDGQQRTRAILKYFRTTELNGDISEDETFKQKLYNKYIIPIAFITKLEADEKIEDFYHRVNSTGLHLNRPEKIKSKYINTNLLQLSESILNSPQLQELELFTPSAKRRMLDRDLVEELILLLHIGISDKKLAVDRFYNKDLTKNEVEKVEKQMLSILDTLTAFNSYYPIRLTRYKQRNDIYTLFSFLKNHSDLQANVKLHFYKILVAIDKEIRPSDNTCSVFKEYALHCVSQSNSKDARERRLNILGNILKGNRSTPNEVQESIMDYFEIEEDEMKSYDFVTFKIPVLKKAIKDRILKNTN